MIEYDKKIHRYVLDDTILQPQSLTSKVFNWFYWNRHKAYTLQELADMFDCTPHQVYIAIFRLNRIQHDAKIVRACSSKEHYLWRSLND